MNKNIGKKLQEARIKQSLSIEKISEETFIRKRFLTALEEGNFDLLPSATQLRGFIRTYSEYLGLDPKEFIDSLKQDPSKTAPIEIEEKENSENNKVSRSNKTKEMEIIYQEIGASIKNRREILGLSLEEIETHTHIPINYLLLVETGSFNKFPSPAQARGMLGNYSKFLNMDQHSIMLRYADALQSKLIKSQENEKPKKSKTLEKPRLKLVLPLWLRNILSADTFVFGLLGIATLIFSIWGISHILDIQASEVAKPTAPALSGLLLPTATSSPNATTTISSEEIISPTDTFTQSEGLVITPTIQPYVGGNIEIYIIVHERTYLRVIVDGTTKFDGRVVPGTNLPYNANQNLELLTGNGSAIQVFYNGDDYGLLGNTGEVINLVYTRTGLFIPTPTPTPTLDPDQQTPVPTINSTETPIN